MKYLQILVIKLIRHTYFPIPERKQLSKSWFWKGRQLNNWIDILIFFHKECRCHLLVFIFICKVKCYSLTESREPCLQRTEVNAEVWLLRWWEVPNPWPRKWSRLNSKQQQQQKQQSKPWIRQRDLKEGVMGWETDEKVGATIIRTHLMHVWNSQRKKIQ